MCLIGYVIYKYLSPVRGFLKNSLHSEFFNFKEVKFIHFFFYVSCFMVLYLRIFCPTKKITKIFLVCFFFFNRFSSTVIRFEFVFDGVSSMFLRIFSSSGVMCDKIVLAPLSYLCTLL